jgi:ATP-binding cassette, subfamily C, bacterial
VTALLPISTPARTRAAVGELLRGRWLLLAGTAVVLVVSTVAILTVPPLLGRIVDAVITRGPASAIDVLALGLVAALLARAVLAALGQVLVAWLGEQMLAGLREQVVRRALDVPLARVERAGTGDLLQRVGGDIAVISEGIRQAVPALVIAVLDVGLTLVGLTVLDWRLGLAGLAPLPVWVLSARWYTRVSGPHYAAERAAEGRRTQSLVGSLGGVATVRAYRLRARHLARIERDSAHAVTAAMRASTAQSRFGVTLNGAEMVGVVTILFTGFLLVRADAITVGAATAAALYFLRLFNPIGVLLFLLDEAQSAGAALARLVGVADLPAPVAPAQPGQPRDASVRLGGIRHTYDGGPEVLHGVDLDVAAGERIAVVGPSGAGKTTLGAVLAGVHTPTTGAVEIGGVALADLAEPRRHVALVTQEVHVFAGTVADNLRLARPEATDAEVTAALEMVGAPLRLDTLVGDGGEDLDATRAQQLALARLILADPAVAVLDEATAEAGSAGARVLEAAADAALAGRTAVVIAHRLTQAAAADRVVVLDKGRIVETGQHTALVSAGGAHAALWAAWVTPRPPQADLAS